MLLNFEDRFYDRPETIDRLAALPPGTLSGDARIRIFLNSRREFVELFIADLEAAVRHRETLALAMPRSAVKIFLYRTDSGTLQAVRAGATLASLASRDDQNSTCSTATTSGT